MISAPRVLVVTVALVAIAFPATAQNEVTERFSKTAHLDENGTFDLTNISGNIVITGSSGRDVTIEAGASVWPGTVLRGDQDNYVKLVASVTNATNVQSIEFTEQRLSEKGMSRQAALALLQRTERWAFGDKGCAIAWKNRPPMEADPPRGTRELVYRGEDCNCQARLVYAGNVLTGLVFRSAC